MFVNNRLTKIFQILYEENYYPNDKMATYFNVSTRTIRNDINDLNSILEKYKCEIILKRNKGYQLINKKNVQDIYQDLLSKSTNVQLDNTKDRILQLLYILISSNRTISLEQICQQIFVGRTTALNYLKYLRTFLSEYQIKIITKPNIGYFISGKETAIRQVIFDHLIQTNINNDISEISLTDNRFFKDIDLFELYQIVNKYFSPSKYRMDDFNRKNFIIYLAITIIRLKNNNYITEPPISFMIDESIYQSLEELLQYLKKLYQISVEDNDKVWVYNNLLSSLQLSQNSNQQSDYIFELIDQIFNKVQQVTGENFYNDAILRKDLFVHFSSYITMKNLATYRPNPLLDKIKQNFSYAFELATLAVEDCSLNFTEDDIGYLALHLASALERKTPITTKKKVLIICTQGISTSRLIEIFIRKHFSDKIEIIDVISFTAYQLTNSLDVDFIVSSTPIKDSIVPVIQFDFLDELNSGMKKIQNFLITSQRETFFDKIFNEKFFKINQSPLTREKLITSLCNELLAQGIVPKDFKEKVLKREEIVPTDVSELIAIPHAIDANVSESIIYVCISEIPISWREKATVKIIFLLAMCENDKDIIQPFFEWLSEILEDNKKQQRITKSNNYLEFITNLKNNGF